MKKSVLFLIVILSHYGVFGQASDSIRLEDCIRISGQKSPVNGRKVLSGEELNLKLKNLGTNWYPAVGFNAQAIYNSETVDFSDVIKNGPVSIPSLPLDQYKVWADINQQLYDGGVTRARKSIEKVLYEADIQQVETELLGVKQQVNQVFFNLLITRKSAEILKASLDELRERKKVIKAGVDNGSLLAENLLSMDAEDLRFQQKLVELNLSQKQLVKVLSILMDTTVSENAVPMQPSEPQSLDPQIVRPEYILFDKQKELLRANQNLVSATDMPKFFAFSQGAYGRPGYDFVSREFHPFYSVGIGMKWNFLKYGDSRRQKKIFELQKNMVDIRKKTFNDQLDIQIEAEKSNLAKYNEMLKQDEEILKLRKTISASSFAKLTNGVITSTDYFSEMNNETMARLQYENHRILKLQAEYNYMLLQGKL